MKDRVKDRMEDREEDRMEDKMGDRKNVRVEDRMKDTNGQENEIRITVVGQGGRKELQYQKNRSLMEAINQNGYAISASCAGRGTCGKCKIQLIEGELEITTSDREKLSERELQQGYRLSCKAYPKKTCTVKLLTAGETEFEVVTENTMTGMEEELPSEDGYGIAIDIGTTTIAICLIGLTSGKLLHSYTTVNKQRAHGADVISRIKASNEGKREMLKECIQMDLLEGIKCVITKGGISKELVKEIVIAGNTTMGHLLMGYSCEKLGVYPFTPVNIDAIKLPFVEVIGPEYPDIPVTILPGISTFVGGDIAAGLLASNFDHIEKPCLFIDLGTNGEMAIGNRNKIIVCSTAAGPAFEGGNISCGVGSIAGAICNINIQKGQITYETISNKPPVGICGTGVIELTAELVKNELVDETGLFLDEYFENGFEVTKDFQGNAIVFSQKDVREIQLAKAAIRAGVETLIKLYGITYEDIDTVYLAGGFGYKINRIKALEIGLIPQELSHRIMAIGNSSLGGAIKYLLDKTARERLDKIIQTSEEIQLSNQEYFNKKYIEHMYF